jgi:conjugative transfer signal peptidase TraF
MTRQLLCILGAGASAALAISALIPIKKRLIWNRTASAPVGLYWLNDRPPDIGDWAVVSAEAAEAKWATERGFTGPDWPLIKRVAGAQGDQICRTGSRISINGEAVATALAVDSNAEPLPDWQGCIWLNGDQVFLLNRHLRSLDGRYFRATHRSDLMGRGLPIWVDIE